LAGSIRAETSQEGGELEFVYIVGEVFAFEVLVPPTGHARVLIVRTEAASNKVLVNGIEQRGAIQGAFLIFDCIAPGVYSFVRT
jgi:hypothetical protein